MADAGQNGPRARWRDELGRIIFGVDTPMGKAFDVLLLSCIVVSVVAVMLESVESIADRFELQLNGVEWFFTILFTLEYITRLLCARRPLRYVFSFYGVVDFISIIPTYLALLVGGVESLIVFRTLRLLRIFRILKLVNFMKDSNLVLAALANSRRKITAFLGTVLVIALIVGTLMYLIEGKSNSGFDSIPRSVYWAVVTVTTVGFGDITPQSTLGQMLAGCLMIMGYAIIAVPTGIVSVELAQVTGRSKGTATCKRCGQDGHDEDARYCKRCGEALSE